MKNDRDEENALKEEFENTIAELARRAAKLSPEERACKIISDFMAIDDPDEELKNSFHAWLFSPRNAKTKERAMEYCFYELFRDVDINDSVYSTTRKKKKKTAPA